MKWLLLMFICFLSFNTFAKYKELYDAYGYDQYGRPVSGIIFTNDQPLEVTGKITDEFGDTRDFFGRWNGLNQVTGEMEGGTLADLKTTT